MKSIYIISAIILFLISCKKSEEKENPQASEIKHPIKAESLFSKNSDHIDSLVAMASAMANEHGKGLDYMYKRLSAKADSAGYGNLGTIDASILAGYSNQYTSDSLHATNFNYTNNNFLDSIIISSDNSQNSLSNHANRLIGSPVSSTLQKALDKLGDLIKDSTKNRDTSEYNSLLDDYVYTDSLSDNEILVFVSGIKVAQNSINYWTSNHVKWDSLSSNITGRSLTGRHWFESVLIDAAFADCAGAIAGSIRGGIAGAGAGTIIPGIGTVAGGAAGVLLGCVGGAVISSGGAMISGTIRHYIGWP